jgi:hypothetical protein
MKHDILWFCVGRGTCVSSRFSPKKIINQFMSNNENSIKDGNIFTWSLR